jgi:hypothetical protein
VLHPLVQDPSVAKATMEGPTRSRVFKTRHANDGGTVPLPPGKGENGKPWHTNRWERSACTKSLGDQVPVLCVTCLATIGLGLAPSQSNCSSRMVHNGLSTPLSQGMTPMNRPINSHFPHHSHLSPEMSRPSKVESTRARSAVRRRGRSTDASDRVRSKA